MKFFKKDTIFGANQRQKNRRILTKANNRLNHIRRKMSRGASNIFRIIKNQAAWGNKHLWGSKEKGRKTAQHKSVTYKSTKGK